MSFTKTSSLLAAAALIAKVSAHGIVQGIVADGIYYPGYQPSFQYQNPPPTVAGWSIPQDSDLGFVSDYSSPDIVCHVGATPGGAYVTVAAGDTVELQWTVWPTSHKGPVMDYLASCNGDCTTVDKTALLFTKIDEAGLINGSPAPGTWASDTMIANNNSWTVTIPSQIAPGKYVLRHETIALHAAENLDGSQAYPQCVNLEITGSGTNTLPTGIVAQDFYKDTDPGILVNIYYPALTNYTIPGPALIVNAVSATQPSISGSATATAKPSSSTTPASTSGGSTSKAALPTSAHFANSTMTTASSPSTKPMTHATALPTTSSSSKPLTSSSSVAAFSHPAPMSSVAGPTAKTTSTMTSSSASVAAFWHPTPMSSVAGPTAKTTSTMTSSSSAAAMSHPAPMSSVAGPAATSTSTSPMSFTSTFTGRIGKPTKFTCYIDED